MFSKVHFYYNPIKSTYFGHSAKLKKTDGNTT